MPAILYNKNDLKFVGKLIFGFEWTEKIHFFILN